MDGWMDYECARSSVIAMNVNTGMASRNAALCTFAGKRAHHGRCAYFLLRQFLAYFPKLKVGLSNHQSVCVYVFPINNF
jgi:hypothetical protein